MTQSQLPVLISGAGLASLLLGQSLKRSNIPFQIFERDASLKFRGQGYRLRLSTEGLDAIEDVLDPAAFQRFYDRCGKTGGSGVTRLNALTGEVEVEEANSGSPAGGNNGSNGQGPKLRETLSSRDGKIVGIARGDMRSEFTVGIEDHIHFNKYVKAYELVKGDDAQDGVRAVFSDGTKSQIGSLLVGGEGIKSLVAKQVSGGRLKVYDTGARGIHGQAPTTAFKGLGEGVFRITDSSWSSGPLSIITNVRAGDMDNESIEFGWTIVGPPGEIKAPNDDYTIVGKEAAAIAKSLTKNWHPRFQPLLEQMNESEAAFWKITCSTPSGMPDWPNVPRVTVIGDAAHSMTPAGGIGANTAVSDSALLGRLIREAGGYKEGLTADYEKQMRVYASEAVGISYGLATSQFMVKIDPSTTPTV